jgi:hypothetical protein
VALWDRSNPPGRLPAAQSDLPEPSPAIDYSAPPAPVVILTPTKAELEATRPATTKPKATVAKKRTAPPPPVASTRQSTKSATPQVAPASSAIPDEPVQVKTMAVDDPFAPAPLAPPDPAPAIESTMPSPEVCASEPLTEGCTLNL